MIQKAELDEAAVKSWQKVVESKRAARDAAVLPWSADDPLSKSRARSNDVLATPEIEELVAGLTDGTVTAEEVTIAHIKR